MLSSESKSGVIVLLGILVLAPNCDMLVPFMAKDTLTLTTNLPTMRLMSSKHPKSTMLFNGIVHEGLVERNESDSMRYSLKRVYFEKNSQSYRNG